MRIPIISWWAERNRRLAMSECTKCLKCRANCPSEAIKIRVFDQRTHRSAVCILTHATTLVSITRLHTSSVPLINSLMNSPESSIYIGIDDYSGKPYLEG